MYNIKAKNLTQLKKELKEIEGKAILKLIRINSFNDGEFLRVLHKVRTNDLVFWDGQQECHLGYPKAKDVIINNNGFTIGNCTYKIVNIMN